MLQDNKGNRLYKTVDVKIYFPDKIFPTRHMRQHAPAGKGFNGDNIDELLMTLADKLDVLYPWWDFNLVELKPSGRVARYAFNWKGYRAGVAFPAAKVPGIEAEADKLFPETVQPTIDEDAQPDGLLPEKIYTEKS
jgi:hypothetical protein